MFRRPFRCSMFLKKLVSEVQSLNFRHQISIPRIVQWDEERLNIEALILFVSSWVKFSEKAVINHVSRQFSKHSAIIEVKVYKYAGTWTIKAISWWCWADRELPPTDSKTWPPPPSHTKFHAARYPIRGKGHRIPQRLECNLRFSCFDDCTDTILPTTNKYFKTEKSKE